jgi:formylglycine-generating enzyme
MRQTIRSFSCNAALALLALFVMVAADAQAVTIAWSPVGNPGNAPDAADGDQFTSGIQNFGAVNYSYSIATYDVTFSQYAEFLNAKDPNGINSLGLYNADMGNATLGGINFTAGNASGNKYTVIPGDANLPVNSVTWFSTIRFANWLNNGQGNGDTENGSYTLLGGAPTPSNGGTITRNSNAHVVIPNENEWYKAAYYNPSTNSYFQWGTSSDTQPISSNPTALPNHANYFLDGARGRTDVGAYTGTTSPYGAFDMSGSMNQWNESPFDLLGGVQRGIRGGSYLDNWDVLLSSARYRNPPTFENNFIGFRLAMVVPEPSSWVLAALGLAGLIASGWRRWKPLRPS